MTTVDRSARAHISLVLASALLAGCGVTIEAKKVTLAEASSVPGIYYTLPRTELTVTAQVVDVVKQEPLHAVFERCYSACKGKLSEEVLGALCKQGDLQRETSILRPKVLTQSKPDFEHLYRLTISAGPFTSAKHEVELSEAGILTKASSSANDQTAEIVSSVFETIIDVENSVMTRPNGATTPSPTKDACVNKAASYAGLAGVKPHFKRLREFDTAIEKALTGDTKDANKELMQYWRERKAAYVRAFGIGGTEKTTTYFFASKSFDPAHTATHRACPATLGTPSPGKSVCVRLELESHAPESMESLKPTNVREFFRENLHFYASVERALPEAADAGKTCPANGSSGQEQKCGYAYRIPVLSTVKVFCRAKTKPDSPSLTAQCERNWPLAEAEVPISQFGALAYLPARFDAKGGEVGVSLSPATGGLTKASIGQTALPGSVITGPLDSIQKAVDDRAKRREDAAKEARGAEKARLQNEKDILQLQKEIRNLQKERDAQN